MNTQKIHIVIWLGMRPYTTIVEKIHKFGACFILHYPASWGRTLRDAVALGFRCDVGDMSVHSHTHTTQQAGVAPCGMLSRWGSAVTLGTCRCTPTLAAMLWHDRNRSPNRRSSLLITGSPPGHQVHRGERAHVSAGQASKGLAERLEWSRRAENTTSGYNGSGCLAGAW